MARVQLEISRRTFLKSALAGAGGVALAGRSLEPANAAAPQSAGLDTALPWFRQGAIETTYNVCDMCPWRCGVTVQTVGGVVRKIDGNPLDPKSRGMLCARGQGGVSFIYDPDRLQSPMARTGERGEGKFQEVTWTEALVHRPV